VAGIVDGGKVRRVGVIGDVHTEADALARVLGYFRTLDLDRILCTGDIPDGPGDGAAVARSCALLREAGATTICGNHDRWLQEGAMREEPDATDPREVDAATRAFLAALPAMVEFETPTGRMLLCHGLGPDDMAGVQPFDRGRALDANQRLQELITSDRYAFVVNGHTHRRMVRAIGSLTVINAGTLLIKHQPSCVVADFEAQRVRIYDVTEDRGVIEAQRFDV
jgi:predicted phosphodiesterase